MCVFVCEPQLIREMCVRVSCLENQKIFYFFTHFSFRGTLPSKLNLSLCMFTNICICFAARMSAAISPAPLATPTEVVPLLNSIIDVCLVYGVDETSSREIPVTEEGVRVGGWEGRKDGGRGERSVL